MQAINLVNKGDKALQKQYREMSTWLEILREE
jgi:hypothetical protein